MPVVIRAMTRLQDGDDVDMTLGAGVDGYSVTYDDGSSKFILSEISSLTVDTRANILASSPSSATLGFTSDTFEAAIWDGSGWYFAPLEFDLIPDGVDMGLPFPLVKNDRSGYTADSFTDKNIYNSRILGSAVEESGSVRTNSGVFQIYLSGAWQDINTGFFFREDSNGAYEMEHKPVGFDWWIELFSGNSDNLGLNGLPLIQQYNASMGAYPPNSQLVGRSITI